MTFLCVLRGAKLTNTFAHRLMYEQVYLSGGTIRMIYISFKETATTVWNVDGAFDNIYEDAWMDDPFVKQMVLDVDKSTVVTPHMVESPILGGIPVTKISGGVKALILLYKRPDLEIWASSCGDNCARWIVEIGKMHDIHIVLSHIMQFPCDFDAICTDNSTRIRTYNDYIDCALALLFPGEIK